MGMTKQLLFTSSHNKSVFKNLLNDFVKQYSPILAKDDIFSTTTKRNFDQLIDLKNVHSLIKIQQLIFLEDNLQNEVDPEIKNLYRSEISGFNERLDGLYDELAITLFDGLPHEKCIVELKPFAGGKDAYLFSCDFANYLERVSSHFNWGVSPKINIESVIFN